MKHNIYMLMLALVMVLGFVSCSDNAPDGPTIFPVTSPERDQLDMWLQKNNTVLTTSISSIRWRTSSLIISIP